MKFLAIRTVLVQRKMLLRWNTSSAASKRPSDFIPPSPSYHGKCAKTLNWTDTKSRLEFPLPCKFMPFTEMRNTSRSLKFSSRNVSKLKKVSADILSLSFRSAPGRETASVRALHRIESVPKISYTMQSMIFMFRILILKFLYCTGQRFAMFEEKVLASTLLRQFHFAYDSVKHGQPNANPELVLRPKHGMPLKISSYNRWM